MKKLSLPIERIKASYDAIVIGSGYGGGIAASRLARAGKRVCVLERGRELQPGEYPSTAVDLVKAVQSDLPLARFGSATALFDIRYNADINVVVGCGLGGTSLINAGILLRPDPRIFEDACWPTEIRNDRQMDRYFEDAAAMLKPSTYPEDWPPLAKTEALRHSAQSLGQECRPVPIAVNFRKFENDLNHVGVTQRPCIGCGDCVSGCNHYAKNTVLMNYLPDAVNHGAEICTEISARQLDRAAGRWVVHCTNLRNDRISALTADIVVLAAGTLGTTEILLRSKAAGLSLSGKVGDRFSANGDTIGFAYNTERAIHGVGFGSTPIEEMKPVGPCSTAVVDLRKGDRPEGSMIVVDGAIPGAMALLLPATLSVAAKLTGTHTRTGLGSKIEEGARVLESGLLGAYSGAIKNTLFYLVVSQDDAAGQMYLDQDRLRIRWPGLGNQKQFFQASELLKREAAALGGTYIPNPVWNDLTNHNLVTGHPLGGCVVSDDAAHGVVNHQGQVYDREAGNSVHSGLYVMDGAVIPRSLGVNPLWTISALAERASDRLIKGAAS